MNDDEQIYGQRTMWCLDCMCKLYTFDGVDDKAMKCPHPIKCEDEEHLGNIIR